MVLRSTLASATCRPSRAVITSPCRRPALAAGLPSSTRLTSAPRASGRPRLAARSGVSDCAVTPSLARRTTPSVISWSATAWAIADGMAKPSPMLPPSRRHDLGVDADQAPRRVDQRAARVAVVDRRVGLQEVLVAAVADAGRPPLGADDAHRHGLADAERIAEGQDDVADAHLVRVAVGERRQAGGLDPHHRQVARRIAADQRAGQRAPVGQVDLDPIGVGHHVVIGQHVAVGADDHTRSEAALAAGTGVLTEALAEELAQRRRKIGRRGLDALLDAQGHDGRRHAVDDRGVGRAGQWQGRDGDGTGRRRRGAWSGGSDGGAATEKGRAERRGSAGRPPPVVIRECGRSRRETDDAVHDVSSPLEPRTSDGRAHLE